MVYNPSFEFDNLKFTIPGYGEEVDKAIREAGETSVNIFVRSATMDLRKELVKLLGEDEERAGSIADTIEVEERRRLEEAKAIAREYFTEENAHLMDRYEQICGDDVRKWFIIKIMITDDWGIEDDEISKEFTNRVLGELSASLGGEGESLRQFFNTAAFARKVAKRNAKRYVNNPEAEERDGYLTSGLKIIPLFGEAYSVEGAAKQKIFLKTANALDGEGYKEGVWPAEALATYMEVGNLYDESYEDLEAIGEVARKRRISGMRALSYIKDIFDRNDLDRKDYEGLKGLLCSDWGDHSEEIVSLKEAETTYGDNMGKFAVFVEVADSGSGSIGIEALKEAETIYGEDIEMLRAFAEIVRKGGPAAIRAMIKYREVYEGKPEVFQIFLKMITDSERAGMFTGKAISFLAEASKACDDNMKMLEILAYRARDCFDAEDGIALAEAKVVYGEDLEKFRLFVTAAGWSGQNAHLVIRALVEVRDAYGDNLEKLSDFCDIMTWRFRGVRDSKKAEMGANAIRVLAAAKDEFGDDMCKMRQFSDVAGAGADMETMQALISAKEVYGDNMEQFKIFTSIARSRTCRLRKEMEELRTLEWEIKQDEGKGEHISRGSRRGERLYEKLEMKKARVAAGLKTTPARDIQRMVEIRGEYEERPERFGVFAEIASKHGEGGVDALLRAKEIWGDDDEKFDFFSTLAEVQGAAAVSILAGAKYLHDSEERFAMLKEAECCCWDYRTLRILTIARDVYGDDTEKLKYFIEVGKMNRATGISYLRIASVAYGENKEMFKAFAKMTERAGAALVSIRFDALVEARAIYGNDMGKFTRVRTLLSKIEHCGAIGRIKKTYGNSIEMFEVFAELAKKMEYGGGARDLFQALVDAKEIYGDDIEMFRVFASVRNLQVKGHNEIIGVLVDEKVRPVYGNNSTMCQFCLDRIAEEGEERLKGLDNRKYVLEELAKIKGFYGEDFDRMKLAHNRFSESWCSHGRSVISATIKVEELYGTDSERFEQVMDRFAVVDEKQGGGAVQALGRTIEEVETDDMEVFEKFATVAEAQGARAVRTLGQCYIDLREELDFDKAVEYFKLTSIYTKETLEKYMELFNEEGEGRARGYILEDLPGKARGLIGAGNIEALRDDPDYQYMVRCVFPKGNYSNHKRNLECGDKSDHLNDYKYDEEGCTVQLSGLLGYRVVEGEEEDAELLSSYVGRMEAIRDFVQSRGPDNSELQRAFEKDVNTMFAEKVEPAFKKIEGLNVKEKMICLFISEMTRTRRIKIELSEIGRELNAIPSKKSGERTEEMEERARVLTERAEELNEASAVDTEILDLVAKYKYAYHDDLETYIAQSADGVKEYKDETSRNYVLWKELSTIYGENVKHVLQNNIFQNLAGEKHYDQIVVAYGELFEGGDVEMRPGQKKAVENTYGNDRISDERRFGILKKQVMRMLTLNLSFKDGEEKKAFVTEAEELLSPLEATFTDGTASIDQFHEVLPKLLALRSRHLFRLSEKVEQLFSLDINNIFQELAKYEENVEVVHKETEVGGEKHKEVRKMVKKRNIRARFMKTQETTNARMGAYLCIAGDTEMWDNKNYFELILEDEDTGKCVGVVMLLNIEAEDGKKYLWFGPNPFESFLDQVSGEKCYNFMYETVCEFAEENNYDGVVVPDQDGSILGACTNRGGDFPGYIKSSRLRDKQGGLKIVDFGKEHTLGGGYKYSKGALVWERGQAISTPKDASESAPEDGAQ
ncbi:hypothetical protein HOG48_06175 [Candidatus Peregrinibacteria bacterium]|jgi:hypothetical protein|nr:hypothetical protein [Candidatus Peregrinibacteria bacterium]